MRFVPKAMPIEWRLRIHGLAGWPRLLAAARVECAGGRPAVRRFAPVGQQQGPADRWHHRLHGLSSMGVALGDATLNLGAMESAVSVKGTLFNRSLSTPLPSSVPPVCAPREACSSPTWCWKDLALQLRGNREIDELVGQLKDLDAHAVLSGHVGVEIQREYRLPSRPTLTELAAPSAKKSPSPAVRFRPGRIGLQNDGDLRAMVAGDHIVLEQARFITDAGRFSVTGELADVNRYARRCRANSI